MTLRTRTAFMLAAGMSFAALPAFADDAACIQSYEQTQTLRRASKLRDARIEAAKCANETCPPVLARDCSKWLAELDQSIPTVVFDVKSATGEELTNVKISVDGKPLVEKLDGKSVALDVGPHAFRFEATDRKWRPIDQKTVIHEGDKNRKISVTLQGDAPQAPATTSERPVPIMAYVFGGVAVASLGVGTVFAISGSSKESDLDACKPSCPADAVNDVSTSYAFADILLAAGVVSAIAAAYVFLSRPTVPGPSPTASATTRRVRASRGLGFEF
jgi:hypothetical protein